MNSMNTEPMNTLLLEMNGSYTTALSIIEPFTDSNISSHHSAHQSYIAEQIFALHRPRALFIHIVVTLIWWFIGFPGNILAFMVWIQPLMRSCSGIYMAALALTDLMFLILHVLFELQSSWHMRTLEYPLLCQTFPVVYLTSQHFSVLLVGAFSVERYISICHPFLREKVCTTNRAVSACVVLGIFSLTLNLVQAYFWHYDAGMEQCIIRPGVMSKSPSVWEIWSWITELFIFGIVPLSILALNILVLLEMRRIKAKQPPTLSHEKAILTRSQSSSRLRSGAPSATTVMILAVSFYLIVVTLPVTFTYVLSPAFRPGSYLLTPQETLSDPHWKTYCSFYSVRVLIQDIGVSHFALNLYIYIATGKLFRKELRRLLARCRGEYCGGLGVGGCGGSGTRHQADERIPFQCAKLETETNECRNEIVTDNTTGESIDKF